MGLTRYPSYKPSGIEWIGEIPSHWGCDRLKFSATINDEVLEESTPDNTEITYVDIGGVSEGKIVGEQVYLFGNAPSRARRLVKEGDIIVSTVRTYLRAIARISNENSNRIVSTGFAVIRPRRVDSAFMGYFLSSDYFIQEVVSRSVGVSYPGINSSEIGNIQVLLPEPPEQTAIAAYLDEKTAQIDKLIAAKRRMIELLKEDRMAIINEAVSGEGKGWVRRKISHGFQQIGSGTTPAAGASVYYDGEINWLQTGDLNDGTIEHTSRTITDQALKDFTTLRVYPKGSLVMAMYGATIGKLGILGLATTTNQACCVMSNPTSFDTKFVFYWLLSHKEHVLSMAYGGGQPNISQELIKSIRIPCPIVNEQRRIVSEIELKLKDHDQHTSMFQREISLLNEYRTSLINEVVTGKLRVQLAP